MLKLNLIAGGRVELPAYALFAVMKPSDGAAPSAVMYDMGSGLQSDQLSDQYGFVRKLALDGGAFENPIEVATVERMDIADAVEGGPATAIVNGKITMSRNSIIGRRDIAAGSDGERAQLFLEFGPNRLAVLVSESLDEMDGVESQAPIPAQSA